MKIRLLFGLVATLVLVAPIRSQERPGQPTPRRVQGSALAFEANVGQFPSGVSFVSRGRGYTLLLGAKETTVIAADGKAQIQFSLIGGRVAPAIGLDQQPGVVNYLIGNDPSQWHVGVRTFARVRYEAVLPGIDLEFYGRNGLHEYDFVVAPGVDPAAIVLDVNGAQTVELDETGDLQLAVSGGLMTMRAPVVYQMVAGERREVSARYVLNGPSRVGFELEPYDRGAPVIIDPQLVYGTFLGSNGNSQDGMRGVDVDAEGNAYVIGSTEGPDFPSIGPIRPVDANSRAIVSKFAPDGRRIYSTLIGGSRFDGGQDIAVRSDGTVYLLGSTTSSDFPVRDAFQSDFHGNGDVFVAELNRDGTAITRATYLGGSDGDLPGGIELARPIEPADPNESSVFGDVLFVYGSTMSPDFPTLNALQSRRVGTRDGFVTMFDRQTLQPLFSTYAGKEGDNLADGLILNHRRGDAYLWLYRDDEDGPLLVHLQAQLRPVTVGTAGPLKETFDNFKNSAFVKYIDTILLIKPRTRAQVRAEAKAARPRRCRFAHAADHIVPVCGDVFSPPRPLSAAAGAAPAANDEDLQRSVFVVFSNGCTPIAPSTTCTGRAQAIFFDENLAVTTFVNFGGAAQGREFIPTEMAVDSQGRMHFIGTTSDRALPVISPVQASNAGGSEGFVLTLDPRTNQTSFLSYLGGSSSDWLNDIAVDKDGNIWIVGETLSADFPVTRSGVQPEMRGRIDGFVVKITP